MIIFSVCHSVPKGKILLDFCLYLVKKAKFECTFSNMIYCKSCLMCDCVCGSLYSCHLLLSAPTVGWVVVNNAKGETVYKSSLSTI